MEEEESDGGVEAERNGGRESYNAEYACELKFAGDNGREQSYKDN